MPYLKAVLSQNIRVLRRRKKVSQAVLARQVGVSTGYIGSIESGHKFPSPEVMERLSEVLGVRPYRLIQDPRDITEIAEDGVLYEIQDSLEKSLISALDNTFMYLNIQSRQEN